MKAENTELIARLADEYVLGALRGAARRRFERIMESRESVRASVQNAEDRMLALSMALPRVQPAPQTWHSIAMSLGIADPPKRRQPLPGTPWRMALAAAVAMLAIGIGWITMHRPATPTAVANLAAAGGPSLWAVSTYAEDGRLQVKVTGAVRAEPGHSYELWALPEGGAPVSLGLMPESGELSRDLEAPQLAALRLAHKVAVSLEPTGGSTTGAPTGPVLYVAELRTG